MLEQERKTIIIDELAMLTTLEAIYKYFGMNPFRLRDLARVLDVRNQKEYDVLRRRLHEYYRMRLVRPLYKIDPKLRGYHQLTTKGEKLLKIRKKELKNITEQLYL